MFFGNICRQKNSEDLLAAPVAGHFQCGRRAKSSFAHASPSHPQPTPTAEPGPIFRVGVTCPQLARLCRGPQFALCLLYGHVRKSEVSHMHPQGWVGHEAKVEGMIENCLEIKRSSVCYEPDLFNYPQILFFIQQWAPS